MIIPEVALTPAQVAATPGISSTGYTPRDAFKLFHSRNNRFGALVCHRRAGKTVACINEAVARATYTRKKNARFAYIAPFYRQAKDVAWLYLKEATKEFAVAVRESELRVILPNGAWCTLYGADNIDALRGLYLDGVIIDEYGDCRPGLWGEVILPTLADRKGWAVFIGTPKGNNHFKHTYDKARKDVKWFSMCLKASQSGILDAEELQSLKDNMSDNEYEQEMECSFQAALLGAFYGDMMADLEGANKITLVDYDPSLPMFVASDLGYTDSTALWFWQVRSDGIAIVDYEEHHTKKLPFYFELLDGKPYSDNYDTIWLPHDAKSKTLQTGMSTIEQFLEIKNEDGTRKYPVRIAPKLDLQDGVNAVRKILPYCAFDEQNCYDGIEALKAYRRKYDDTLRAFSNHHRHDWSSHGADAFRYLALVTALPLGLKPNLKEVQGQVVEMDGRMITPKIEIKTWHDATLDELHQKQAPTLRLSARRRI